MARVSIKPIEPLEMEFEDGIIKRALFNNEAFIIYTDEFGSIDKSLEEELKDKPYDFTAKILYCGMKVLDRTVTLEQAESIIVGGGTVLLEAIANLLIDNFMVTADESSKKKFFKEVEKFNKTLSQ
ncbi:hypothetical protein [Tissierella sp.]|uniref:hypothetical protein n=1 Tax=Tissierella sp. TaxID=41274 RepID=UPI0030635689